MKMKRSLYSLFVLLIGLASPPQSSAYQNPLTLAQESGDGIADPCILKWQGKYYLYATRGAGDTGLKVWHSDDLVNWSYDGFCSTDPAIGSAWAPDVFYHNGTFYLYASGPDQKHKVLTASSPLGPFGNATLNICPGIDGSAFMDDDGQLYFSYAGWNGIKYKTMSSPSSVNGSEHQLTSCKTDVGGSRWTEGPQIFKKDGTYYMHYCGADYKSSAGDYQVHAAKGSSVAGLSAQTHNPILVKTSGNYQNVGHNYVILGPDLKTYYTVYHTMLDGSYYRKIMVDRLWFNKETGDSLAYGPTFTSQPNPAAPTFSDAFNRTSIGSGWANDGGGNWGLYNSELMWGDSRGQSAVAREVCNTVPNDDFVAEFNTKLMNLGSGGSKYGVFIGYDGGQNEFRVQINPATARIETLVIQEGIDMGWWDSAPLPAGWNHYAWHTIRVEKKGSTVKVFYDNMLKIERQLNIVGGKMGLLLENCHADFGYCAFSDFSADEVEQWDYTDNFNRTSIGSDWFNVGGGSWNTWDQKLMYGSNKGVNQWAWEETTFYSASDYTATWLVRGVYEGTTAPYPKYGVFSSHDATQDSVCYAWIDNSSGILATWIKANGSDLGWQNTSLPSGFNMAQWHAIKIVKSGSSIDFYLDGQLMQNRTANIYSGGSFGCAVNDFHADFGQFRYRNAAAEWDWYDNFDRTTIGPDWTNFEGGSWGMYNSELMWGSTKSSYGWGREITSTEKTSDNARIEMDTKLMSTGNTSSFPKYGLFASHQSSPGNYFIAWIDPVARVIATWAMQDGTDLGWQNSGKIPFTADLYQWHTIRVDKCGYQYRVYFDNIFMLSRKVEIDGLNFGPVIEDTHADFGFIGYKNLE